MAWKSFNRHVGGKTYRVINAGQTSSFAQTRFELELDDFLKNRLPQQQLVFVKKISLELLKKLVKKSPVDTGRFRGNWFVALDFPDRTISDDTDKTKTGRKTISRGRRVIEALQAGHKVIISNNLPYAVMLEYGWSNQAPQGVVAVSLEEVRAWADRQK